MFLHKTAAVMISLSVIVFTGNSSIFIHQAHANEAAPAAPDNDHSCSIFNATYKPHPSYFLPGALPKHRSNLDFTLTVHAPLDGEKGGSHRSVFFYLDAFDHNTNEKVSTLRMADVCSNGIVRCGISTQEGQFRTNEEMQELKAGIGFEPIALNHDLFSVPYSGPDAPYAFILPNTANEIHAYYRKDSPLYQRTVDHFVHFYTDQRVFPDFSGFDIWILSACKGTSEANLTNLQEFAFKAFKSASEVAAQFPFLADRVWEAEKSNLKAGSNRLTHFDIAQIDIQNSGVGADLVFLRISGPLTCGTAGCDSSLYEVRSASDYSDIFSLHTHSGTPIYFLQCKDDRRLLVQSGHGIQMAWTQWRYDNHSFKQTGTYPSFESIPLCVRE